jgi:Catalytic LigB subunit of aromatic ring-opening dioxygenase
MVDRLGVGIGDIDEEFDRWFVKQLEQTELGNLLDMPNDELTEAGNGTGELGAWVALAGSMRGHLVTTLSYGPIYEWINGMGVVMYDDELPSTA